MSPELTEKGKADFEAQQSNGARISSKPEKKTPPRKSKKLFFILIPVVLIFAGYGIYQKYFAYRETTDDAQIDGHINPVAAKVSGHIAAIRVEDNQQVKAGTQCTYNAKTANVQCTGGTEAKAEVMTAEATMGKLAHCGIDCRKVDAQVLAAKLAETKCCNYTQEQWLTMVKSAQALDAKQADAIFATATSEKPCTGEACPMTKVAKDMAAAQGEEKKETTN